MDFIGNKCPVCEKYFHADDDIVVCPECGTPHHRECYESLGHCANQSRHADGYDYAEDDTVSANTQRTVTCPSCGKSSDADAFFCKFCGAPLSAQENQPPRVQGFPYNGAYGQQTGANGSIPFMDPLGGIPADADFGDGVTAGEAAKYVKQNTPYYVRIFQNIRTVNRSKFNFGAALFSGGFLLYRKMYKIGAFITAVQLSLMILSIYVQIAFSSLFTQTSNALKISTESFLEYFAKLSSSQLLILTLPDIVNMINLAIMIVVGLTFNRLYFKHCREQIVKIKNETPDGESPETVLQTKGGVNIPLAISLLITYFIISYLPGVISAML